MSKSTQIYCREPKNVQLIDAEPTFKPVSGFVQPKVEVLHSAYSPSGDCFAYTEPEDIAICDTITGKVLFKIENPEVFDFEFSPKGHFLTSWSKPVKADDDSGNWKDNVVIYKLDLVAKKAVVIQSYLNKMQSEWKPQFTSNETLFCRKVNGSLIEFYETDSEKGSKSLYSLNTKSEGTIQNFVISPSKNQPSIAIFIPGAKGNAAYIQIYSLPDLKKPTSQKRFFKGETCQFRWNSLGTSLLALVTTDVDTTNKSYYGESQLYLLDARGTVDTKINLEKEGPIHDITWSPNSREFAVIYGYMPSNTTFFDARGNEIHTLPEGPRNTIIYSPHAKYILVAGFGNLQGNVEIFDRQWRFKKVAEFNAANTSVCKWSPDGRFVLTATSSPRLRVDNCVKIWYFNGTLCYIKPFDTLYDVDWRYQPLTDFRPISTSSVNHCDVSPDHSAVEFLAKKKSRNTNGGKSAPRGAYRPPHARGRASTPARTLAQVEAEQSGKPMQRSSSSRSAHFVPGSTPRRTIPGYTPKRVIPGAVPLEKKTTKKKKRHHKKSTTPENTENANESSATDESSNDKSMVVGGVFTIEEKKTRNLLKKLRSIQKLKIKQANGEFLQKTQESKIESEPQVRQSLAALGWKDDGSE